MLQGDDLVSARINPPGWVLNADRIAVTASDKDHCELCPPAQDTCHGLGRSHPTASSHMATAQSLLCPDGTKMPSGAEAGQRCPHGSQRVSQTRGPWSLQCCTQCFWGKGLLLSSWSAQSLPRSPWWQPLALRQAAQVPREGPGQDPALLLEGSPSRAGASGLRGPCCLSPARWHCHTAEIDS